ncbi:hypothetical protein H310_04290 [Aphanomyces invadans]|uniref:Uncharacterized protein n=1 Tax=Aphanomyces invadans TaxID=157072 RepID=A0A024UIC3_9STRA|nr:hypothetical protein H310_04290 [Aphanomyces invadans]ETW05358.1 hypothetical protein H310_04290 [Aphanomyces invadans]|eukprot:XP_008866796.1 hypothetical protein H310_04290 [Aphanomyces invadans]
MVPTVASIGYGCAKGDAANHTRSSTDRNTGSNITASVAVARATNNYGTALHVALLHIARLAIARLNIDGLFDDIDCAAAAPVDGKNEQDNAKGNGNPYPWRNGLSDNDNWSGVRARVTLADIHLGGLRSALGGSRTAARLRGPSAQKLVAELSWHAFVRGGALRRCAVCVGTHLAWRRWVWERHEWIRCWRGSGSGAEGWGHRRGGLGKCHGGKRRDTCQEDASKHVTGRGN